MSYRSSLGAVALAALSLLALPAFAAPSSDEPACLAPGQWARVDGGTPQAIAPTGLLTAMAQRDLVLLGEQHDDIDHHRWQLHTLAALHAQRPHMVIGFEMFPRRAQPV
ncbi:MAG: ChaN family lipoprotein, partial [Thauera sp.]